MIDIFFTAGSLLTKTFRKSKHTFPKGFWLTDYAHILCYKVINIKWDLSCFRPHQMQLPPPHRRILPVTTAPPPPFGFGPPPGSRFPNQTTPRPPSTIPMPPPLPRPALTGSGSSQPPTSTQTNPRVV